MKIVAYMLGPFIMSHDFFDGHNKTVAQIKGVYENKP